MTIKKILFLVFLFCGLQGMTQNKYAYFAKNGMLVDNARRRKGKTESIYL